MYTTKDNKDKKEIKYSFRNINQFVNFINEAPTSKHFKNHDLSSQETGNADWYGTETYTQAQEQLKYGWNEGFEKFVKLKKKFTATLSEYMKVNPKPTNDVVGVVPNVARYVMGHPQNMINYPKREVVQPVINIYNGIQYHSGVKIDEIMRKGAIVLAIIDLLEKKGYRVNLYSYSVDVKSGDMLISEIKLKDAKEPLNIKKLYYPLVSPSFLRRQSFRLTEVAETNVSFTWGYGRPLDKSELKKYELLPDNGYYAGSIKDCQIIMRNMSEDVENTLKSMGLDNVISLRESGA